MHIEVLVEDDSGKKMLEILLPKLLGDNGERHSWRIRGYKGAGHIAKNLKPKTDAGKRILLDRLHQLLSGYGRTPHIDAVVVVLDADSRNCKEFLAELQKVAERAKEEAKKKAKERTVTLTVLFRLAIEEIEAWYLGDRAAIFAAYPEAKRRKDKLKSYKPDSIVGTWELLADLIHREGAAGLKKSHVKGEKKCEWAEKITPHMELARNSSPSFQKFCAGISRLCGEAKQN